MTIQQLFCRHDFKECHPMILEKHAIPPQDMVKGSYYVSCPKCRLKKVVNFAQLARLRFEGAKIG